MADHARLSPSAAHRWLNCTAAPTLESHYEDQTSEYAREGTFAHTLAELCTRYATEMIDQAEYEAALAVLKTSEFYNQEMQDHCEEYAAYIKEKLLMLRATCPDAFAELEVKLDLTSVIPDGFGTADCIIVAEPEMWVIDFKYGKGVEVSAKGNPQMEIYAMGALAAYKSLYDIETIGMTIVQPRLGGVSEYQMEVTALRAWASVCLVPMAREAYEGPGRFRPSDSACRFCKAKADCAARADYYISLFEDNPIEGIITLEDAGEILRKAAGMTKWLEAVEEKVKDSLMRGDPVEGWKLVEGRSNRKYADEDAVAEVLKKKGRLKASDIYVKKLNTITNLEKLIGKKKFAELLGDLIIKPAGAPTLAPADDKRPEIFPAEAIVEAFDE